MAAGVAGGGTAGSATAGAAAGPPAGRSAAPAWTGAARSLCGWGGGVGGQK